MKLFLCLVLIFLIFLVCTSRTFAHNDKTKGGYMERFEGKKILIAYFSWSGNTKQVAQKIHNTIGGNMLQIETETPYPSDYNETAYGIAKKQHEENTKPKLKSNKDVSGYDIIFVGTPAWWYEMAPAVKTFLTENNFEGKTTVPFITHGGGGKYNIAQDMAKLAKNANVIQNPLVFYGNGGAKAQQEVDNWLKQLK